MWTFVRFTLMALWADCVEKLYLFEALIADSIFALIQGICRDDGTEAGGAAGVVL